MSVYNGDIARRLWEWKGLTPKDGMIGGWKAVHPDLTTRAGFQWPAKGKVKSPGPWTKGGPCPSASGDGLCVAVTFSGAASGSIPAITGLLVEYAADAVLGTDTEKVRVRECRVAGLLDISRAAREGNLAGASLVRADLAGASLAGASLAGASLAGAGLVGARLVGASLVRADLAGADLARASLVRADLAGASLVRANLVGARLVGARLAGADLAGAVANKWTVWPDGFDPKTVGVVAR